MTSFIIDTNIRNVTTKLYDLYYKFDISIPPNIIKNGFNVSNPLNILKFQTDYLMTQLSKFGFALSTNGGGFRITNQLGDIQNTITQMDKFSNGSFILKFDLSSDKELTLKTYNGYDYDYTVDWGDGTIEKHLTDDKEHIYNDFGTYFVVISGTFQRFRLNSEDRLKTFECVGVNLTVIDSDSSWGDCTELTSFDSSGLIKVANCEDAWNECTALTEFNSSGLVSVLNCQYAWNECTALTEFNSSGLTSATECEGAWFGCTSLETFDASGLNSAEDCSGTWEGCTSLVQFDAFGLNSAENCSIAWGGCTSLTEFKTSGLNSVTNCVEAWEGCASLAMFDSSGLTAVTSCTDAWDGTPDYNSVATFIFSDPGTAQSLPDLGAQWDNAFTPNSAPTP